jgi:hypothetical protein
VFVTVDGQSQSADRAPAGIFELPGGWSSQSGDYAEVIDLDDFAVGRARSLITYSTEVHQSWFSFHGRTGTESAIDPLMESRSNAVARAEGLFEAVYDVTSPLDFDLTGSFAGSGDVGFYLWVDDFLTKENIFREYLTNPQPDGMRKEFALSGTLDPGVYHFKLVTESKSLRDGSQVIRAGGGGEFAVDFATSLPANAAELMQQSGALDATDFNLDGIVNGMDLERWQEDIRGHRSGTGLLEWQRAASFSNREPYVVYDNSGALYSTFATQGIPEPAALSGWLLVLACYAAAVRRVSQLGFAPM